MGMDWLFGKRKTPQELLRENKRMLDRAIRELDRERMSLQAEERKLIVEIKRMAREGQMPAVNVMAKSLVRNRHAVNKLFALKSQLQAVSLHMSTLKSTAAMADSMKGATKAMGMMNRRLNLPALSKITREFERQSMMMEQTEEMLGDAIDDVTEGPEQEEESKELIDQVLAEIGINTAEKLAAVPNAPGVAEQEAVQPQAMAVGGDRQSRRPPPGAGGGGSGGSAGGGAAVRAGGVVGGAASGGAAPAAGAAGTAGPSSSASLGGAGAGAAATAPSAAAGPSAGAAGGLPAPPSGLAGATAANEGGDSGASSMDDLKARLERLRRA